MDRAEWDSDERRAYWRGRLEDAPVVELPLDRPREGTTPDRTRTDVPSRVSAPLLPVAALAILLSRYTRQSDIVIGVLRREDAAPWPLRLSCPKTETPRGLTEQISKATEDATRYAAPSGTIAELIGRGDEPMFRVAISFVDRPVEGCDVVLYVESTASDQRLTLDHAARLIGVETAHAMAGSLALLLRSIADAPDAPLSELQLLNGDVERDLVVLGSGPTTKVPFEPVDAMVRDRAERFPEMPAVQHGKRIVSYSELTSRAHRLARWLRRRVPARNARIGVFVERSPELPMAQLAVWTAGHAVVALDSATPAERVARMLESSAAARVLCTSSTAERIASAVPADMIVVIDALERELAAEPDTAPPSTTHPQDLAYIIFTSGSTGEPKGVLVQHEGLSNLLQYDRRLVDPGERATQVISSGFDASIEEIWCMLSAGATSVIAGDELRLAPAEVVRWLADEKLTRAGLPAAVFQACLPEDWSRTSLKKLGTGLEKLPALAKRLPFRIGYGYGPTECTICATEVLDIRDIDGPPPIGRPLDNIKIYLLDDQMRLVPRGALGEAYIAGICVAHGYLRADLTAERFLPDPFGEPGSRMYRTGDLMYWRGDGMLQFAGRADSQVKVRGYRIELGEIEAAIGSVRDVRQAVVLALEGATGTRLVAYVAPLPGKELTRERVIDDLRRVLPTYMVPAAIVVVDSFPLTTNGKVDRKALSALPLEPIAEFVPPRTDLERLIAAAFAEVLAVERVGAHDDFFVLGGHSLVAAKVVSILNRKLGSKFPAQIVLESPVVSELAARIERRAEDALELPAITRSTDASEAVPSFVQDAIAHWERSRAPSSTVLLHAALAFTGRVDIEALKAAIGDVLERQDSLRTRVNVRGPSTIALAIAPASDVDLAVVDGHEELTDDFAARVLGEARAPFPLSGEVPVRIRIVRVRDDRALVFVVVHPLLSDPDGLGVFSRELASAYERLLAGAPPNIASPTVRCSDFARWERDWFAGAGHSRIERARRRLVDVEPIELPTDRPRAGVPSAEASETVSRLGSTELGAVQAICRKASVTPYMLFLVAVAVLVRGWTGSTRVPIGAPTTTRSRRPELDDLVGRCFNIMTNVVDVSGTDPTVGELLERVRGAALQALELRDVPAALAIGAESPIDCSLNRIVLNGPNFLFAPRPLVDVPGLSITPESFGAVEGARNELTISAYAMNERMLLSIRAAKALFDEATTARLMTAFREVLLGCEPHARLSDLLRRSRL